MPAMYPEELAKLRADHPNLQYDFRGNVTGVSPAYAASSMANNIRGIMNGYQQPNAWDFGPTRADFQNSSEFIGPLQPQWWDPNGELNQMGGGMLDGFMQGRDLQPRRAYRPRSPYAGQPPQPRQVLDFGNQMVPPEVRYMQQPALHADAQGILKDAAENKWGVNPLQPYTYAYRGYGAPYPYNHDDGSGEFTPGI